MAEKLGEMSDTGDESAGDQQNLVDSDESDDAQGYSRSPKGKKYTFPRASKRFKYLPGWCQPENLSRNERICLVAGIIAVVAIIVVFITIAVTASPVGRGGGDDNGEAQETDENGTDVKWSDVRLQSSVTPDSYSIAISVDMASFQVVGSVRIECSVTSSVDFIAVHVKDMDIASDGHTLHRNNQEIKHNEVWYKENDFFIFNLSQALSPGSVTLYMKFNYTLRTDLAGFYRSSYKAADGSTHYLGTTQFEPTDARRAFPCFDEPSMKANFSMQIIHHSNYSAWFNMPLASRSEEDSRGYVTSKFETSLRMSSYLVAFIVSDFECVKGNITSTSGNEVMVSVCSNPVVKSHTHYALEVAKNVIMFYEQEFGIPYPLPKQDLFAIPDFAVGAMENWGLITYRETALLYNEETDPAVSKQRVAVVIAHELAHQWFGNLVTMAWWDGLWLNEGFASFMEYLGTNIVEPTFHMMQQFFFSDFAAALDLDGLNESHPILQEVASPDEINSLFDSISYSKGASIIRMLKSYIGDDAFRKGITHYLQVHKYGNAETQELWESLQDTSGRSPTVTEVMDTWTKQMGYPVITVSRSEGTLSQTRFFYVMPEDKNTITQSPYNYIWKAPFNYISFSDNGGSAANIVDLGLLTTPSKSVSWPSNVLIKANINQTGFYRVNYDLSDWTALGDYLLNNVDSSDNVLAPIDRAGLLDDVFALSSAGMLDIQVAFNFSKFLVKDTEYLTWAVAMSWFGRLDGLLKLSPKYGIFREIVKAYLSAVEYRFSTATPSSELSHLEIFLRSAILKSLANYGNQEVIANATELFKEWKTANTSIDPNLKSLVYGQGVAHGQVEDWNFVWNNYLQSQDPYEKRLYLMALAQSSEPWILNRYLNYSLTKVRTQDSLSVIVYVSRNIHGRFLAWNFVRANWDYLLKLYGQGSFFSRFILYITRNFATEFELQELKTWYSEIHTGTAERGFRQAIEVVRGNIAWLSTF